MVRGLWWYRVGIYVFVLLATHGMLLRLAENWYESIGWILHTSSSRRATRKLCV
jgi:hypothetical protein